MEIPFNIDLGGKVAVVTGGSGVLCREFCRALGKCGAKVAIIGRNFNKAENVALEIAAEGGEAAAFSADVTDRASVEAVYRAVLERFGKCDILINGAGGNDPAATTDDEFFSTDTLNDQAKKSFFDLEPEGFSRVFDKNMVGVLLPTRFFGRDMALRGQGVVLNISSMNALRR